VIIVDKNNVIIAWHGRLAALKKMWIIEIPVIKKLDLDIRKTKRYRLLDNKLAELATDNKENIKIELEELDDIQLNDLYDFSLDLDESGFWDDFSLPDWSRAEIETVTFTLHYTQNAKLKEALEISKNMWWFDKNINTNINWNALARIIEIFIKEQEKCQSKK
jgi:hypothetical protein